MMCKGEIMVYFKVVHQPLPFAPPQEMIGSDDTSLWLQGVKAGTINPSQGI
jgi:hypothetical protein